MLYMPDLETNRLSICTTKHKALEQTFSLLVAGESRKLDKSRMQLQHTWKGHAVVEKHIHKHYKNVPHSMVQSTAS